MGTNTGLGIGIGIPFKNFSSGGRQPLPPDLKASLKGVWIAYGKSNNDADRSIVKNLVDPDNPFVISNAAYDKMSSYGGYEFAKFDNTLDWYNTEGNDNVEVVSRNGHSITLKRLTGPNFWYFQNSTFRGLISNVIPFKVNSNKNITVIWDVHGLSISEGKDKSVRVQELVLNPNEDNYTNLKTLNEEELAQIDISTNSLYYILWFDLSTLAVDEEVTIEMLPLFEGAFVTDGIDDLITSTKTVQEMGITDEITVVSMIHKISSDNNWTNLIGELKEDHTFVANRATNTDKTGIYGYTYNYNENAIVINNILGDKNDYIVKTSTSLGLDNKYYVTGFRSAGIIQNISQIAWYWTFIANRVLTTDEINQVIAYYNLDRTLKPDILCNTIKQGITNENHAEFGDKLIDFSGNGRDIQLNNIAWNGGSGIGKYETDFTKWLLDRVVDITIKYSSFNIKTKNDSRVNSWVVRAQDTVIPSMKVKVTGISSSVESLIYRYSVIDDKDYYIDITSDGIYELPQTNGKGWEGFRIIGKNFNISVEQIPSHAGALCLDGVNDFGKVTGMPIYKDYTIVVDYERISGIEQAWAEALISKSYIANQGAFVLMETNGTAKHSYSFGAYTTFNKDDSTRTLLYQSKYKCGDVNLNVGTGIDRDTLWLGTYRDNYSSFFNGAIYSLMSFPYSMSEFLIERQLKKHKLGTLYPDMVEFRPVIKTNTEWEYLEIYQGDNRLYNLSEHDDKTGIYLEENSSIEIYVKPYTGQKVSKIVYNGTSYIDLENNGYGYYYITVPVTKSPQKIGITIEWMKNYVQWNPVVESNVAYKSIRYYKLGDSGSGWTEINIGDYIPIGRMIMITINTANTVDELVSAVSSQLTGIGINGSNGTYNITGTLTSKSPQKINITIDEYIRYEDIVQPYPVLLRFKDESGKEVSYGDKIKVGSSITRIGSFNDCNLLKGIYTVSNAKLNGSPLPSTPHVVERQMVFTCTATYLLDNNEPKCILSPRLLRIPNSSYKILGYIPDISGHGNNGVIHNSAYAEGSGVNEDGSYQLDGVDDFVTIPTTVGGKQVLMKVNLPRLNEIIYDQRKETNTYTFAILTTPSQIAYDQRNSERITYIDGILNTNIIAEQLMGVTHNIVVINSKANLDNTRSPIIGRDINGNNWSRMRIYDFMLFDEISTDDKIKELNEYVGIEAKVELPPYYWDTYGKTNSDADRDTIQQRGVAVGDYDLTNTNFAYDKMSGFGGYEFEKFTDTTKWIETKREDGIEVIEKNDYSFTAKKVGTGQYFWDFKNNSIKTLDRDLTVKAISNNNVYIRWEFKYRTAKKPDIDSAIILLRQAMTPNVPITVTLPYKTQEEQTELGVVEGSTYYLFYFDPSDIPVGDEYTVEMLPLYPNGLLYDGVTDYSKNANIPALDDFTAIIKREWLKKQGCPLIKGSKVYEGGNGNALLLEWDKAYNFVFYKRTDIMEGELPDNISFITPTNYNGNVITRGSEQDTNGICIAGDGNAGFANMVFYKLILYPKTIPLLQINFLKNLMERDEIIDLNNPIFIKNE